MVRKSDKGIGVDFDGVDNDAFTISSLLKWLKQHHRSIEYFPVHQSQVQ